jgi:hypothetical protein
MSIDLKSLWRTEIGEFPSAAFFHSWECRYPKPLIEQVIKHVAADHRRHPFESPIHVACVVSKRLSCRLREIQQTEKIRAVMSNYGMLTKS